MIEKKMWYKYKFTKGLNEYYYEYTGIFLFGIIPIYISRMEKIV